jgi:hypothetical protein
MTAPVKRTIPSGDTGDTGVAGTTAHALLSAAATTSSTTIVAERVFDTVSP